MAGTLTKLTGISHGRNKNRRRGHDRIARIFGRGRACTANVNAIIGEPTVADEARERAQLVEIIDNPGNKNS